MTPRKIATFAIGPLGAAVLGLITLPVITWYFSQEDVGRIAMLQVTLGFSILLFSLGLDQSYVREYHESEDKPALFKHAALPGFVSLILTLGILLSLGGWLAGLIFGVPEWYLSLAIAIALVASYLSRFFSLVLRMNERGLAFSMSQMLPKLLLLLIIGGYIVFGVNKHLTNLILANTAALVAVCVFYGWNTRQEWFKGYHSKLNVGQLKSMFHFGFPLILGGLAFWGLTAIDKIFLRTFSSFEELGVYSVAVSFAAAASILQSVFSTVWAPTVYKWASTGQGLENVQRVSRYILALVIFGFALVGLFSWVVTLFLPDSYSEVRWIVVSCIGYPLLYTLSETTVVGIGISRRSSFAMLAAILAFVVNLVGNWLLIPLYGAAGAAVSTCVSFWIFFVLRTEFSILVWKPMPRLTLYTYSAIVVTGAVFFTLWGSKLGSWMPVFWGLVVASWMVVFRGEVREAYKFVSIRIGKNTHSI